MMLVTEKEIQQAIENSEKDRVEVGDILKSCRCGYFKVIKIGTTLKDIRIKFFDTGYERITTNQNIKSGLIKDPFHKSALGIGWVGRERRTKNNKINKKCRLSWNKILEAQACGRARVSNEWLNFANFEKWFYENITEEFDHIVKDSRSTIYCRQTVRAVTGFESRSEVCRPRMKLVTLINVNTGEKITGLNMQRLSKKLGMHENAIGQLYRGVCKISNGWKLA